MAITPPDNTQKASHAAQKLRQVQAGLADSPAETRKAMLEREIGASIGDEQGEALRALLESMLVQFQSAPSASSPARGGSNDAPANPQKAAQALASSWAGMSEPDRAEILKTLAPILPPAKGVDRDIVARDVCAFLKIAPDQVNPQRVGELCAMLLKMAQFVETVWQGWGELSQFVMRPSDTRTVTDQAAEFLTSSGPEGKSKAELELEARRVGRIVAALLGSIHPGVNAFAGDWVGQFAPREILSKVRGGGIMTAKEVLAWQAYENEMKDKTKDAVAEEVLEAIRELVKRRLR